MTIKIVNAVAAFVIRAYDKEAQRLHKLAAKVDSRREVIVQEVDVLQQQLRSEIQKVKDKFGVKQAALLDELTKHDAEIDDHITNADNATEKAKQVRAVLK